MILDDDRIFIMRRQYIHEKNRHNTKTLHPNLFRKTIAVLHVKCWEDLYASIK
jgi:hypothetical protein